MTLDIVVRTNINIYIINEDQDVRKKSLHPVQPA